MTGGFRRTDRDEGRKKTLSDRHRIFRARLQFGFKSCNIYKSFFLYRLDSQIFLSLVTLRQFMYIDLKMLITINCKMN